MAFEVDGERWLPISYQQDSLALYQEAVTLEGELRQFATVWDRNLLEQGFLAEAERRTGQGMVTIMLLAATEGMCPRQMNFEVEQAGDSQIVRLKIDEWGEVLFVRPPQGEVTVGGQLVPLEALLRRLAGRCGPDEVGQRWTADKVWLAVGDKARPQGPSA
jgi:hypothetical protein